MTKNEVIEIDNISVLAFSIELLLSIFYLNFEVW